MTNKEIFIKIVQEMVFDLDNLNEFFSDEEITKAIDFWEDLKNDKIKNSGAMTENGKKLLSWMQKNVDTMTNIFTSKEAAEALFTALLALCAIPRLMTLRPCASTARPVFTFLRSFRTRFAISFSVYMSFPSR